MPSNCCGLKNHEITVVFENCKVKTVDCDEKFAFLHARDFESITFKNFEAEGKISAIVKKWSDGKVNFDNVTACCDTLVIEGEEQFKAGAI